MDNPLISIIIPVYNVEDYIRPCLDSILAQTYTNFEAILVDDGSKDGSGRICDEYAEKDSRFVVVHKENEGVAKARITAFEHSKGELITFIDSDDYVSPLYLEKLSKPIIEEDADMVSCDYYYDKNGKITESTGFLTGTYTGDSLKDLISNHFFYDKILKTYGIPCFLWTKMIKKEFVLEGLEIGLGLWYGEDQLGVFCMLQKCKKLIVIHERLYFYMIHEGQAISKYNINLWDSLIQMMERTSLIANNTFFSKNRRLRTWIFVERTLFIKMKNSNLQKETFCKQLSKVRNQKFMKDFFSPWYIEFGLKDNIKYWLIKLKLYSLIYSLINH